MKLLLGPELWAVPDIITTLTVRGHEVSVIGSEPDAIIGYEAWRIPPGTPLREVQDHIDMILKQIKATKHVQSTEEDSTSVRTDKKSRNPIKRKPSAKTDDSTPKKRTRTKRQPDTTSNTEGPEAA